MEKERITFLDYVRVFACFLVILVHASENCAASVGDFRDLGYLPETLVNYLALLGWNPGDDREVMTIKEMVESFTLERINPKSASFDEKKLQWMNGQHIHMCDDAFLKGIMKEAFENNRFIFVRNHPMKWG